MNTTEKGEIKVVCDDCGETYYGGTLEFMVVIENIKEEGWKIKKVGDTWEHYCPDCKD